MKGIIITFFLLTGLSFMLYAGEISTSFISGAAIGGYDPVSYHLSGFPQKGLSSIAYSWKDAEWRFSSVENRDLFAGAPEKYAPRYGGHCANGLSENHKVNGNPGIWSIYKSDLFFFYSEAGKKRWEADTENKIRLADNFWETVKYD